MTRDDQTPLVFQSMPDERPPARIGLHIGLPKTGRYTQNDYRHWLSHDLGDDGAARMFALLDYEALYDAYVDAFGADRVHVRLYEKYQSQFAELAAEFSTILGIAPDRARALAAGEAQNVTGTHYSGPSPGLQRFARQGAVRAVLNLLPAEMKQRLRSFTRRVRSFDSIDDETRKVIRGTYATSNRSLFQRLGIEINGLGYE